MQVPEKPRNLDGIAAQELARNKAYWERRSPIYRRTETKEAVKSTFQRKTTLPTEERLREIRLEEQQRRWFKKVNEHWDSMRDMRAKEQLRRITVSIIVDTVCELYNVNKNHLIGRVRTSDIVLFRAAIVSIARDQGRSFPHIGRILGRDHSSIIHLHKKYSTRKEVIEIVDRVMPFLLEATE